MSNFKEQEKQSAIKYLKTLDQSTVIDSEWYDYLWDDVETLEALKALTNLNNYQTIHKNYEGYTISELIQECS